MRNRSFKRLRSVLLAIAAIACVSGIASTRTTPGGQPGATALRVMSYNIHRGAGTADGCPPGITPPPHCDFDLARAAEVIRADNPDIVALQEVDRFWNRSARTDQPAELAAALDMRSCYGANLSHSPDNHSSVPHEYGTAILSKYDVVECRNTLLPSTRPAAGRSPEVQREQRGLLEAVVSLTGVRVRVYNTHLEHAAQYRDVRAAQVNRIVELVGKVEEPAVLMGDLNAQPDGSELQPLFAIFRDAWRRAGDGSPGYTYPADPISKPDARIDYILVSPRVSVTSMQVLVNDATRRTSDHYPIRADVSVPAAKTGIRRR